MTAYDELAENAIIAQKRQKSSESKITPANLPHNDLMTVDDLLQKARTPEMVLRRKKGNS
jgi:hypothetical protein